MSVFLRRLRDDFWVSFKKFLHQFNDGAYKKILWFRSNSARLQDFRLPKLYIFFFCALHCYFYLGVGEGGLPQAPPQDVEGNLISACCRRKIFWRGFSANQMPHKFCLPLPSINNTANTKLKTQIGGFSN